jgi:hypothetical protein
VSDINGNECRNRKNHSYHVQEGKETKRPGSESHFQGKHPLTKNFLVDSTSYIFIKHANARLQTNTLVHGALGNFKEIQRCLNK